MNDIQESYRQRQDFRLGVFFLLANLIVSVASQLMLKQGMLELGEFEFAFGSTYFLKMMHPLVIGGLILYACGTVFWLLCLNKLDLSFAYPAGTLQYLFIFAGAWYWFDEEIPILRLLGLAVILFGVLILTLDTKKH